MLLPDTSPTLEAGLAAEDAGTWCHSHPDLHPPWQGVLEAEELERDTGSLGRARDTRLEMEGDHPKDTWGLWWGNGAAGSAVCLQATSGSIVSWPAVGPEDLRGGRTAASQRQDGGRCSGWGQGQLHRSLGRRCGTARWHEQHSCARKDRAPRTVGVWGCLLFWEIKEETLGGEAGLPSLVLGCSGMGGRDKGLVRSQTGWHGEETGLQADPEALHCAVLWPRDGCWTREILVGCLEEAQGPGSERPLLHGPREMSPGHCLRASVTSSFSVTTKAS